MNIMIGNNIRNRRKSLKVTQGELADLAGISINTLYKIEREQSNPTLAILNKIASVLGMELTIQVKES